MSKAASDQIRQGKDTRTGQGQGETDKDRRQGQGGDRLEVWPVARSVSELGIVKG